MASKPSKAAEATDDHVDVGYCAQMSDDLKASSQARIEEAIWENIGVPAYLTVEESRILIENESYNEVAAQVYFQNFLGIDVPKIKKGAPIKKNASELPNSQISAEEWPGLYQCHDKRMGKHFRS